MSQFFFTPLSFQAARNRYRDRLQEMNPIAFPGGGQSFLDANMSPEEADKALENALESRLHQGTVSGNLIFFAGAFSNGKLSLDGKTVREMILAIDENRELLERGIRNRYSGDTLRVIAGLLAAGGAGFLCGRWSAFASKAPLPANALKTLSALRRGKPFAFLSEPVPPSLKAAVSRPDITANRLAATSGDADNAQFLMIAGVVLALAVILGVVFASRKAGKRSPQRIEDGLPDKERALEVLTLAECLADIYRDERN